MSEQKPLLFIDVDGVLFGIYDGTYQMRPSVWAFIQWCNSRFECWWLTSWPHDKLKELAGCTFGIGPLFDRIGYCEWRRHDLNKAAAALELANGRPFLWIEDGLPPEEAELLKQNGVFGSYIAVRGEGRDELYRLRDVLEARLKELGSA